MHGALTRTNSQYLCSDIERSWLDSSHNVIHTCVCMVFRRPTSSIIVTPPEVPPKLYHVIPLLFLTFDDAKIVRTATKNKDGVAPSFDVCTSFSRVDFSFFIAPIITTMKTLLYDPTVSFVPYIRDRMCSRGGDKIPPHRDDNYYSSIYNIDRHMLASCIAMASDRSDHHYHCYFCSHLASW